MGSYVDICPGNATGANRVAGKKRLTVSQQRVNYYAGKPKIKRFIAYTRRLCYLIR